MQQKLNPQNKCDDDYVSTLEYFLAHSNKDTLNIDAVMDELQTHFCKQPKAESNCINILDIGPGNGAKTFYLIEQLRRLGIESVLDVIEPKESQRQHLANNHSKLPKPCLNHVFTAPLVSNTSSPCEQGKKYDLVLMIHSLYEFPRNDNNLITPFQHLPSLLKTNGLGLIINEHPKGDFQHLKRELYPNFSYPAPTNINMIMDTLNHYQLTAQLGKTIEYNFDVTDLISQNEKQIGNKLSFLFSTDLTGNKLSTDQAKQIGLWVKTNAKQYTLYTPDQVIWFSKT